MADLFRGEGKAERHAFLGVAVDAVGIDLLHERGDRVGPRLVRLVGALVPHHHGKEHADAAAMEVGDHPADAFDAAGHGLHHLELVAVIDAHVGIGGPDQYRVDAAVALFEVVEITVHSVAAGDRIVEVAVVDHHLRLHEAGLGPLEGGQRVARGIVGDANAALRAPVLDVAEPALMGECGARRLQRSFPGEVQVHAVGRGNLLSSGRIQCVLRVGCKRTSERYA